MSSSTPPPPQATPAPEIRKGPSILIIGAVPPPYVGPYLAMQRLLASEPFKKNLRVHFLDTSDHRETDNIGQLDWGNITLGLQHAAKCLLILLTRWPRCVYLGISQGTWGYLRDLTFILPAVLLGRRIVIHLRGSEFDTFYRQMPGPLRLLTKLVFRRVDLCIVLGETLRRVMSELLDPDRIRVIPNGIDVRPFDDYPRRPAASGGGKRILFLSHLMRRKGIFEALEAFALVLKRHPDARLTMAGGWQNRADEDQFMERLKALGIQGSVSFTGVVHGNTKFETFASHDIFFFPPVEPEGLPWVILEAMSSRLPVVSTSQGAIAEVVRDGTTGFVCKPVPADLAARLCQLIEQPELAAKMGQEGHVRVSRHYSEDTYQKAVSEVLKGALA
jgi:glycosyltransferase involved in cell wall biosynthesis